MQSIAIILLMVMTFIMGFDYGMAWKTRKIRKLLEKFAGEEEARYKKELEGK